jgi:integrase
MRAGELVGLQWGDIDFRGKFLTVRRAFTRGREEGTKTGKTRRVDISDALLHELQALKKRRQESYLKEGKNEIPLWVFCNQEGNPLEYYNLKHRHFEKCLAAAGLRRIRFHDLRHTFASLLIQNGESLAYIKDQLGHSSIKMTVDVYGHLVPGANRAAVNKLPTTHSGVTIVQSAKA